MGVHTQVHVLSCGECGMHSDRCSEHLACAGVYVKQVLCASAYIFVYTLATGCAYALMCACVCVCMRACVYVCLFVWLIVCS